MKTPRNILLASHQTAAPQLDAIRRAVVKGLNNQAIKEQSQAGDLVAWLLGCSNKFWQELISPCRRVWTGLVSVWIFLLVVNLAERDNVSSVTGKPVPAGQWTMSQQAQQRWMNELLADRTLPPEADRPRSSSPKPRSELAKTIFV